MTHPNLTSELRISDPGEVWQSRPGSNSMHNATASDPSGFARTVMQDGQVTRMETGKAQQTSSHAVANEATAAAGVPWLSAEDPVYRCRQSPYEVTEASILTFPGGGQCTLPQAKAAGLILPGWRLPGTYPDQVLAQRSSRGEEGNITPMEVPQPKPEVHPDLKVDLLTDETADRDYSALVDGTSGADQLTAIQQIVDSGAMDERTLGNLASQLRCEPGQLKARMAPIMAAFEGQARSVLAEGGLDSDDVLAYAQKNCPDKLRQAMYRQGTLRQTSGYAEIRQSYLEGLADHNPGAALGADLGPGFSTYMHNGKVAVRAPDGSTMLWRSAISAFGRKA